MKYILFQKEVTYLVHIINENVIAPGPGKVEAVKPWQMPTSVTELKGFLELCSYYWWFTDSFTEITHPLHKCITASPFLRTEEAD